MSNKNLVFFVNKHLDNALKKIGKNNDLLNSLLRHLTTGNI